MGFPIFSISKQLDLIDPGIVGHAWCIPSMQKDTPGIFLRDTANMKVDSFVAAADSIIEAQADNVKTETVESDKNVELIGVHWEMDSTPQEVVADGESFFLSILLFDHPLFLRL